MFSSFCITWCPSFFVTRHYFSLEAFITLHYFDIRHSASLQIFVILCHLRISVILGSRQNVCRHSSLYVQLATRYDPQTTLLHDCHHTKTILLGNKSHYCTGSRDLSSCHSVLNAPAEEATQEEGQHNIQVSCATSFELCQLHSTQCMCVFEPIPHSFNKTYRYHLLRAFELCQLYSTQYVCSNPFRALHSTCCRMRIVSIVPEY